MQRRGGDFAEVAGVRLVGTGAFLEARWLLYTYKCAYVPCMCERGRRLSSPTQAVKTAFRI